jgi:hypothetical protein
MLCVVVEGEGPHAAGVQVVLYMLSLSAASALLAAGTNRADGSRQRYTAEAVRREKIAVFFMDMRSS